MIRVEARARVTTAKKPTAHRRGAASKLSPATVTPFIKLASPISFGATNKVG